MFLKMCGVLTCNFLPSTATPGCILGFPPEPGFLQGVCVHPAVSRGPQGQGLINQMPMLDTMQEGKCNIFLQGILTVCAEIISIY